MLENSPIMPALCLMLFSTYYAENYAGIIYLGLLEELLHSMLQPNAGLASPTDMM